MNRLGILFIFGALIISAIFTALVYKHQKQKEATAFANSDVLVATKNLTRGTVISDTDITWKSWPQSQLSPQFIVKGVRDKSDVVGSLVREPINADEPIVDAMFLSKENMSALASVLKPGMRAFNVNVTLASSLGGLINPGDSVDVILSYSLNTSGGVNKEYITKTILFNIPVIAVDQSLSPNTVTAKANAKMSGINNNSRNVTLEVTPQQAEILALGQSMGTLSLSLTGPASESNQQGEFSLPTLNNSDILNSNKDQDNSVGLTLIHGDRIERAGNNGS